MAKINRESGKPSPAPPETNAKSVEKKGATDRANLRVTVEEEKNKLVEELTRRMNEYEFWMDPSELKQAKEWLAKGKPEDLAKLKQLFVKIDVQRALNKLRKNNWLSPDNDSAITDLIFKGQFDEAQNLAQNLLDKHEAEKVTERIDYYQKQQWITPEQASQYRGRSFKEVEQFLSEALRAKVNSKTKEQKERGWITAAETKKLELMDPEQVVVWLDNREQVMIERTKLIKFALLIDGTQKGMEEVKFGLWTSADDKALQDLANDPAAQKAWMRERVTVAQYDLKKVGKALDINSSLVEDAYQQFSAQRSAGWITDQDWNGKLCFLSFPETASWLEKNDALHRIRAFLETQEPDFKMPLWISTPDEEAFLSISYIVTKERETQKTFPPLETFLKGPLADTYDMATIIAILSAAEKLRGRPSSPYWSIYQNRFLKYKVLDQQKNFLLSVLDDLRARRLLRKEKFSAEDFAELIERETRLRG